jgi:hypothetical protein
MGDVWSVYDELITAKQTSLLCCIPSNERKWADEIQNAKWHSKNTETFSVDRAKSKDI